MGILGRRQITSDYFWINSDDVVIPAGSETLLYQFSVTGGEVVDLQVNLTSDEVGKNNELWLYLF